MKKIIMVGALLALIVFPVFAFHEYQSTCMGAEPCSGKCAWSDCAGCPTHNGVCTLMADGRCNCD